MRGAPDPLDGAITHADLERLPRQVGEASQSRRSVVFGTDAASSLCDRSHNA